MNATLDTYDTERELIGILLTYPTADGVRECWDVGLTPEDFSREQHRVIYTAIVDRLKGGSESNALSLIDHLQHQHVPTERGQTVKAIVFVGGPAEILSISEHSGGPSFVRGHAEEIVRRSLSRQVAKAGAQIHDRANELEPIASIVTDAERVLAAARDRSEGRHSAARRGDVGTILQGVLEAYISPEPDDLLSFQLPTLDAIGGGMAPGDIVVVGARSGVGKTWWGLGDSERTARVGRRTVYFSLEMPKQQLMRRLLAMGGHNLTALKKRLVPYEDLVDRIGVIDAWRDDFEIHDGATSVDRMQAVLASARIDGRPIRLLVVDHLHLVDVPGSKSDYRVSLNQELTRIKHLAGEHGCTIVLLAQLNRPKKGDEAKRPTIHDLRESGAIGDIADYVLLLHREPSETGYASNNGVVIVDKVRDGAGACDIDMVFDPRNYHFSEGYLAGMRRVA